MSTKVWLIIGGSVLVLIVAGFLIYHYWAKDKFFSKEEENKSAIEMPDLTGNTSAPTNSTISSTANYTITESTPDANHPTGWPKFSDNNCPFTFFLPSDWEVKDYYFYETAGGEKVLVPTIVLGQKGVSDVSKNTIVINPRQSTCMEADNSQKSKEVFLPNSSFVGDLVSYPDQAQTCEEATREGKNKNGVPADYHFYSLYDNSSGIKEIFKNLFLSFNTSD